MYEETLHFAVGVDVLGTQAVGDGPFDQAPNTER